MIYNNVCGNNLSLLGFGTMRLPLIPGGTPADIDQEQVQIMTDYAIAHGINYFDTAYPYHGGKSELSIAAALAKYPRESYYLADKYPGHQISSSYNPEEIFEDQLSKCNTEYFDFYLLHNVNEKCIPVYLDKRWGIIDYFVKQKELGRVKKLGFSSHAGIEALESFLDSCGFTPDFVQIQLNYLDWSLQDAKAKYELLTSRNIPVWVMEPVRGGKLASFSEEDEADLKAAHPDESIPAWAFRWLQSLPNVKMILSGMSNFDQMKDNVHTFEERKPLTDAEKDMLSAIAEKLKKSVPCTSCRYCCDGCPKHLNIPYLISMYNECLYDSNFNLSQRVNALTKEELPDECIGCGKCKRSCPQGIDIPELMKKMPEAFAKLPDWNEVCRQREEAAMKIKAMKAQQQK